MTASVVVIGFAPSCDRPPEPRMPYGRGYEGDEIAVEAHAISAMEVAGDGVHRARILESGHVVVMPDRGPALALYAPGGDLLWRGPIRTRDAEGLVDPRAMAVRGDTVLTFSLTSLSRWLREGDSLRWDRRWPLGQPVAVLGAAPGCADGWLVYGPEPFWEDPVPGFPFGYLHSVTLGEDSAEVRALWRDSVMPGIAQGGGDPMTRLGGRIVVFHRTSSNRPGRVVEFDCSGRPFSSVDEQVLIAGADSSPVLAPRPAGNPVDWISGVGATHDGWVLPMHRFFPVVYSDRTEQNTATELFRARDGRYVGSVMLAGQWNLWDYQPGHGMLLERVDPPMLMRVPPDALETWFTGRTP